MISVLSGTDRPDSYTLRVAKFCTTHLESHGLDHQGFGLEALPASFFQNRVYGATPADFESIAQQVIVQSDRFIIVVPEYNGSYPGVLKHFMDVLPPSLWKFKRCALIGLASGRAGNLRGLDHLTAVCHYLQMEVYSQKPVLSAIHKQFDAETGDLINPEYRALLENFLTGFLRF